MTQSMTGYGKSSVELPTKNITIEVKTLNSKQLDVTMRIPQLFRSKEMEIRQLIKQCVMRGKVEFSISMEQLGVAQVSKLNKEVALSYFEQLDELCNEIGVLAEEENILETLLKLPDVMESSVAELSEEEWVEVVKGIETALEDLVAFRQQEGASMQKGLLENVARIETLMGDIVPFEKERVEKTKERLLENLKKLAIEVDQNRLEQELIYYLEKYDINEERVRLDNHCQYFRETISQPKEVGKKLGFIAQEMGREINTVGSKANHAEIQRRVVLMKDELEKIKEQCLNIL